MILQEDFVMQRHLMITFQVSYETGGSAEFKYGGVVVFEKKGAEEFG